MRIVTISDTHALQYNMVQVIPAGDVVVHAGDIMNSGYKPDDISRFLDWFGDLPYSHKIFIAGNHDRLFENEPNEVSYLIEQKNALLADSKKITYLQDEEIVIDGVKFYGSPWQPEFCNWAFNLPRNGVELKTVWNKIPTDTDVLITHTPAMGILDCTHYGNSHVGCELLLSKVLEVQPLLHVFGHIHEDYGVHTLGKTTFVNASVCTLRYSPINKILVFDVDKQSRSAVEVLYES